MKYVASFMVAIIIGGLIYFGPEIKEHFGTRYASADREVFENSKPFIHGTIENLNRLRMQYEMSDNQKHRNAIKTMIVSQTATLDKSQLPYDLQQWVNSL
ncbi:MAG: hypothetical protein K6L81_02475 [Agarilytica sp.]